MRIINILLLTILVSFASFARQDYVTIIEGSVKVGESASASFDATSITDIAVKTELVILVPVGVSSTTSETSSLIGQARVTVTCSNGSILFQQDYSFSASPRSIYEDGFQNPFCGYPNPYTVTITILSISGGYNYAYVKFSHRSGF